MALAIEDNFESYSNGSINGLNGGSGWSAAWTETGSNCDIQSTVVNTGSKAAQDTDGSSGALRTWSAEAAGVFYVSIRCGVLANGGAFYLKSGASAKCFTSFRNSGSYLGYYNGSVYANLGSASVNTWYRVGVEWDNVGHPNQWRLNLDGGTWTAWANCGASFSSLDTIGFNGSGDASYDSWFDDISMSYSSGASYTVTATSTINMSNQTSRAWRAFLTAASSLGVTNIKAPAWAARITNLNSIALSNVVTIVGSAQHYVVTVQSIIALANTVLASVPGSWVFESKPSVGTWAFTNKDGGTWSFIAKQ